MSCQSGTILLISLFVAIAIIVIFFFVYVFQGQIGQTGQACTTNADCFNGNICSSDTNTCLRIGGAECNSNSQCISGICGTDGYCQSQPRERGSPCNNDNECQSGETCNQGICKSSVGGQCDGVGECAYPAQSCINNICSSETPTTNMSVWNNNVAKIITNNVLTAVFIPPFIIAARNGEILSYIINPSGTITQCQQSSVSYNIDQLLNWGSRLIMLSNGRLFSIDISTLTPTPIMSHINNIIYITTMPSNMLWIQTQSKSIIIGQNSTNIISSQSKPNIRRTFGNSTYVDNDLLTHIATQYTNENKQIKIFNNVSWVGFNNDSDTAISIPINVGANTLFIANGQSIIINKK